MRKRTASGKAHPVGGNHFGVFPWVFVSLRRSFTLKPHRFDAVLFYADIKTLKGLKPLSAYSAKQNTGPFRIVLKVR